LGGPGEVGALGFVSKSRKELRTYIKYFKFFMEMKLYLEFTSLNYLERDGRTLKMIRGAGGHQLLKIQQKLHKLVIRLPEIVK
jgi:hypothetical protein